MKTVTLLILFLLAFSKGHNPTEVSEEYHKTTISNLLYHIINPEIDAPVNHTDSPPMHRFMVIGDFGNILNYFNLNRVANIMNDLANEDHYDYIITVGDNFYLNGIKYIWFRAIPWLVMTVFKKNALKDVPFYPTLGNHDCYGDMNNELLFSNYDSQWEMHDDYYTIKQELPDGSGKHFVNLMLNTCKLYCPDSSSESETKECLRYGIESGGDEVRKHYEWVEDQLQAHSSDPDVAWIAVTLHHPVFTKVGLKNYLLPLLRKYKVDIMFVGHEHQAEYTNMDYDYELRFPNSSHGEVLEECKGKREIMTHPEYEQTFGQHQKLHMILVGNGGAAFRNICPFRDQDGEVYWRNTEHYGAMKVEVNSTIFSATFLELSKDEVFKINITR